MPKNKILVLARNDNSFVGHGVNFYNSIPEDRFEKRLLTLESLGGSRDYAFHNSKSIVYRVCRKLKGAYLALKRFVKYGEFVTSDSSKREYCFYTFEDGCLSGRKILKKLNGFKPDIIAVYWAAGFVSTKTIRELYDMTHAIVFLPFVDEVHLAGGCHYHVDCNGYLTGCNNCPALKSGKRFAKDQMDNRLRYLKDIPLIISGTEYDMEKAMELPIYKKATIRNSCSNKPMPVFSRSESRDFFHISENSFVVFIGANSALDKRKGFGYAVDAINKFSEGRKDVVVLVLAHGQINPSLFLNVCVVQPGFLNQDGLAKAYCASDIFLSTTIADSGPQMVNFSFNLGVPVISFDLGIAHTLIIHHQTGCFAKFKDVDSIAQEMEYVYNLSSAEKALMSERQKEIIKRKSNETRSIFEIFEEALQE